MKKKIAVLIGKGTKLGPILEYIESPDSCAEIITVISYKKDSSGVELAKSKGIDTNYFNLKEYRENGKSRNDFENDLIKYLKTKNPDLIVLAGWIYLVSEKFIKEFSGNIINLHPALLTDTLSKTIKTSTGEIIPVFKGMTTTKDAFDSGVSVSGCTVHFVTPEMDVGPVIIRGEIKRDKDDTIETFEKKIHDEEDRILPEAIKLFCARLDSRCSPTRGGK